MSKIEYEAGDLKEYRERVARSKADQIREAELVEKSKQENGTAYITQQLVVSGLKFIAENQDISQEELVQGLLQLGCNFTSEDIALQIPEVETSVFDGMKHGDLFCGAKAITTARKHTMARDMVHEKFLSVDDDISIYNYIRVATNDETYTKEKIASMNNDQRRSKTLK